MKAELPVYLANRAKTRKNEQLPNFLATAVASALTDEGCLFTLQTVQKQEKMNLRIAWPQLLLCNALTGASKMFLFFFAVEYIISKSNKILHFKTTC